MKIKRMDGNGVFHDIELTANEILEAYLLQEEDYDKEDALDEIDAQLRENYASEFERYINDPVRLNRLADTIASAYRSNYTWLDAGRDQMERAVREELQRVFVKWNEEKAAASANVYAEYHIMADTAYCASFTALRNLLGKSGFPVNDWYEEDGKFHLNEVFVDTEKDAEYLEMMLRCFTAMMPVPLSVIKWRKGFEKPDKFMMREGAKERHLATFEMNSDEEEPF